MRAIIILMCLFILCANALKTIKIKETNSTIETENPKQVGCLCGVFMSTQFKKGSKEQPKGNPALVYENPTNCPCSFIGNKLCIKKCINVIIKHIPGSASILCRILDRDCYKEQAYLFIKNCKDEWINTNLSAGREYCCKDGISYKCPILF